MHAEVRHLGVPLWNTKMAVTSPTKVDLSMCLTLRYFKCIVSLTFKGFLDKNVQIRTQSLILITKSMTYRAFYYKIQISVTPDKNLISAQAFG